MMKTHPSEYAALLLRLALAAVMLAHAAAKLFIFTLPGTVAFFSAAGFPGWTAYPVFALEALGGLALLVGWQSRIVSLLLIPVMLGAATVHLRNGWMFTAPNGGWEYPVFLIAALGSQALLGNGAWAFATVAGKARGSHGMKQSRAFLESADAG